MTSEQAFKILFPIGCRSDRGLVEPIIRRLKKESWCEVWEQPLIPMDFAGSLQIMQDFFDMAGKPDLVFINADRVEMMAATCAAFLNNVKIAHYQAGVVNDPITTYDDIFRHCMTLMSDIQFCESNEAQDAVYNILLAIRTGQNGEFYTGSYNPYKSIELVGITHLDDLEIDESKVPKVHCKSDMGGREWNVYGIKEYDLVLYNTPTMEDYRQDIATIERLIKDNYSVLVSGNPDGEAESQLADKVDEFHIDLPRPQFFGLLKNCSRFITNSSSAIYEAPYFLKPEQIIMVGNRNRNRPPVECKPGGSNNIVRILKEYAEV